MESNARSPVTRILAPLDGSRLAEAVLPTVEALCLRLPARVTLIHIVEAKARATVHGDRHLVAADDAAQYLDQVAGRLRASGVGVDTHVHDAPEGNLARSLIAHAEELSPNLVVLCAHGQGGVRDVVVGGIAQQVLKRGTLPVLMVHPDADGGAPLFDPRWVLVPLDGEHAHEVALALASDIARAFDATLELVLVVPTMKTLRRERAAAGVLLPTATRAMLDMDQEWAAAYLAEEVAACRTAGLKAESAVLRGDVVPEVLAEAERRAADLIAMVGHGRAGLDAVLSGSVTPQIAARAKRPLLLVRRTDQVEPLSG